MENCGQFGGFNNDCFGLEQSIKESKGYNEMLLQQVLREALQGNTVINE